jgi:hypothetical protein
MCIEIGNKVEHEDELIYIFHFSLKMDLFTFPGDLYLPRSL